MKILVDISRGMKRPINYIVYKGTRYSEHSALEKIEKHAFEFSSELSYKNKLIKEYEKVIDQETQESIKNFIFSEFDR